MAYGCGCLALAQQGILLQLFNAGDMWTAGLAPGTAMLVGRSFMGNSQWRVVRFGLVRV